MFPFDPSDELMSDETLSHASISDASISPMPSILAALIPIFALLATVATATERHGQPYAALSSPQPSDRKSGIEVVQVFWYGCPSCYQLEERLEHWLDAQPQTLSFQRMPAVAPRWEPHARAFYAAESLGALDAFHQALMARLETQQERFMSEDDLVRFAEEMGLDADAFRQAYQSPGVERRVQRAAELTQGYEISGDPALIINGRYRTDLQLAGDQATMIEAAQMLIDKASITQQEQGRNRQRR